MGSPNSPSFGNWLGVNDGETQPERSDLNHRSVSLAANFFDRVV